MVSICSISGWNFFNRIESRKKTFYRFPLDFSIQFIRKLVETRLRLFYQLSKGFFCSLLFLSPTYFIMYNVLSLWHESLSLSWCICMYVCVCVCVCVCERERERARNRGSSNHSFGVVKVNVRRETSIKHFYLLPTELRGKPHQQN